MAQIFYYLVVLLVLQLAFNVFGDNPITEALDGLVDWLPKLIVAVILVIIGGLVANVVGDLVRGATAGQTYSGFVTRAATIAVWLFFGLAAIDQIEIGEDLVDTLTTAIFASPHRHPRDQVRGVGGIWGRPRPVLAQCLRQHLRRPPPARLRLRPRVRPPASPRAEPSSSSARAGSTPGECR